MVRSHVHHVILSPTCPSYRPIPYMSPAIFFCHLICSWNDAYSIIEPVCRAGGLQQQEGMNKDDDGEGSPVRKLSNMGSHGVHV